MSEAQAGAPGESVCLRVYFRHGARVKSGGFWGRLLAAGLGHHLMREAKKAGIAHALLYAVPAEDPAAQSFDEDRPPRRGGPACVELLDERPKLEAFLKSQTPSFGPQVRVVLLRHQEVPLWSGGTDHLVDELEHYFHEHPSGPGEDPEAARP